MESYSKNNGIISNPIRLLSYRSSIGRDTGPQVSTFLRHWAGDGRTLHFALVVYYDARIVLKVEENAIPPAEGFSLPDDDRWHDLLTQFRFTFLDGGDEHVTNTGGGQSVQATTDSMDGDHVQVLGT